MNKIPVLCDFQRARVAKKSCWARAPVANLVKLKQRADQRGNGGNKIRSARKQR